MTTYRASLGTRGELRRIAAEAETATIDRVRPWERKIQPCKLAPHVIVPQWIRSELPPKPRPSPVISTEAQIVVGETLDALLEAVCSRKLRIDCAEPRANTNAMQIDDSLAIHPIVQPQLQPPPSAIQPLAAPMPPDAMLALNDVDLSLHLGMSENDQPLASTDKVAPTEPMRLPPIADAAQVLPLGQATFSADADASTSVS